MRSRTRTPPVWAARIEAQFQKVATSSGIGSGLTIRQGHLHVPGAGGSMSVVQVIGAPLPKVRLSAQSRRSVSWLPIEALSRWGLYPEV